MKNNDVTPFKKRFFGGSGIDCVTRQQLVEWCLHDICSENSKQKIVMDVNGHGLSLYRTDPKYKSLVDQADIIHADGGFLVSLSKLLPGNTIPERSATTDMIHDFSHAFSESGNSFYILGGKPSINEKAVDVLKSMYPGLNIAGKMHGYFELEDLDDVINDINKSNPDVIWLGMGKPLEQEIALRLRGKVNAKWIITCGGCYNYITGDYKRAPLFMQKTNLEWLHRLVNNPKNLLKRYLVTSPHALWIALTDFK